MYQLIDNIVGACAAAGLDLHAITSAGAYNATIAEPFHLPGRDDALTIVVGNTRALWPHVGAYVRSCPVPPVDPVDSYVESSIGSATSGVSEVIDIRYSHEPPPRRIAFQRLAHVAGLAWLSPSHLCVHPEFGPWLALRAAIVLDVPAPPPTPPPTPPCDCSNGCGQLLVDALAGNQSVTSSEVQAEWRRWLAVRDACPVGRRHRYDDDQIEYHYIGTRPASWGVQPPL